MFNKKSGSEELQPVVTKPQRSPFKWVILTVGAVFGVAHLGIVGHLLNRSQVPIINLPVGDYTAYQVEAMRVVIVFNTDPMPHR